MKKETLFHVPVGQLEQFLEEILVEELQFLQCEIVRHLFFEVKDGIFDVESHDLTRRDFFERFAHEERESLEDELVLIVVDHSRMLDEEVGGRRDRNVVMMQLRDVVCQRVKFQRRIRFPQINAVTKSDFSGLNGAAACGAIVKLSLSIFPELVM